MSQALGMGLDLDSEGLRVGFGCVRREKKMGISGQEKSIHTARSREPKRRVPARRPMWQTRGSHSGEWGEGEETGQIKGFECQI